jgi:ABC-type phosphate/phosphonate transport system substrate-binding protein
MTRQILTDIREAFMATKTLLFILIALSSGCAQQTLSAAAQPSQPEEISFLSVGVDQSARADERLKKFLEKAVDERASKAGLRRAASFSAQTMDYGGVIRALVERDEDSNRGYLARITPYAYVAAEMLGARLKILAVYRSDATNQMTYHSYFVVNKKAFSDTMKWKAERGDPELDDVVRYVQNLKAKPATFIYHDRFSTSSYFLPSLFFKKHGVFAMERPRSELTPISVSQISSNSSGELLRLIATEKAHLAAVWDGPKKSFEKGDAQNYSKLLFIQNPSAVPNDFLVASGIDEPTQRLIVDAIVKAPGACIAPLDVPMSTERLTPKGPQCNRDEKGAVTDDFDSWYAWDSNDSKGIDDAREALARLRQEARTQVMPVVVRVRGPKGFDEQSDTLLATYVNAAKEAVRLSGTEFILEDPDLHRHPDMTWMLESTHDGAIKLTSMLDPAFKESKEVFYVSFLGEADLPQRIADLVRTRLRRIRYVWPYETKYPAVLRDLDFTPERRARVQKISWQNPQRNQYEEDTSFEARIEGIDFSKFQLSHEKGFATNADGSLNFDPMSNVAYRVVISREPHASWIWVALPYAFIALFGMACVGLVVDLRRHQQPPRGLQQTYRRIVEDYHGPWLGQELEDGAIVWSDPKKMDETVARIKSQGSFLDLLAAGAFDFEIGPIPVRFSLLVKLFRVLFKGRRLPGDLPETHGGSAAALDSLIQCLVSRNGLSPFIGFRDADAAADSAAVYPAEWEALDDIVSRHLAQLGISDKPIGTNFGSLSAPLVSAVATHFQAVLKKAKLDASLFCQTWKVEDPDNHWRLVYERDLHAPLVLRGSDGSARRANRVRLDVSPRTKARLATSANMPLRAWVFGKIHEWSVDNDVLVILLRPIAVVRDYAHQH